MHYFIEQFKTEQNGHIKFDSLKWDTGSTIKRWDVLNQSLLSHISSSRIGISISSQWERLLLLFDLLRSGDSEEDLKWDE